MNSKQFSSGTIMILFKMMNYAALYITSCFCSTLGRSKANQGWTPLHLAAYFGHISVVKALLEVSLQNVN